MNQVVVMNFLRYVVRGWSWCAWLVAMSLLRTGVTNANRDLGLRWG